MKSVSGKTEGCGRVNICKYGMGRTQPLWDMLLVVMEGSL